MWTPCDEVNENGVHVCPYKDTYAGYEDEMCRNCCGLGVDEDDYPEEEYEEYDDYQHNMPCDNYGMCAGSSCSQYYSCQGM